MAEWKSACNGGSRKGFGNSSRRGRCASNKCMNVVKDFLKVFVIATSGIQPRSSHTGEVFYHFPEVLKRDS